MSEEMIRLNLGGVLENTIPAAHRLVTEWVKEIQGISDIFEQVDGRNPVFSLNGETVRIDYNDGASHLEFDIGHRYDYNFDQIKSQADAAGVAIDEFIDAINFNGTIDECQLLMNVIRQVMLDYFILYATGNGAYKIMGWSDGGPKLAIRI